MIEGLLVVNIKPAESHKYMAFEIEEVRELEDGYITYRKAYCKAEKERIELEKALGEEIEFNCISCRSSYPDGDHCIPSDCDVAKHRDLLSRIKDQEV